VGARYGLVTVASRMASIWGAVCVLLISSMKHGASRDCCRLPFWLWLVLVCLPGVGTVGHDVPRYKGVILDGDMWLPGFCGGGVD
jgi:hypothetical protein